MSTTEHRDDPEYPSADLENDPIANMDAQHMAGALLGELALSDARKAREHPEAREPVQIEQGFSLSFECEGGIVGLWSCWLKDSFYLGFPMEWGPVPEEMLQEVFPTGYLGQRLREDYGRSVGDYVVPIIPEQLRATLEIDKHNCYARHFHVLQGERLTKYGPPQVTYGWGMGDTYRSEHDWRLNTDPGRRVFSEPFWRPEGIAPYLDEARTKKNPAWDEATGAFFKVMDTGFRKLACALAVEHGCTAITAEMGVNLGLVPEHLPVRGFDTKWLKGEPGKREGWGADAVYARKLDEEIMLVSANSLVPWQVYRRQPCQHPTPGFLHALLRF